MRKLTVFCPNGLSNRLRVLVSGMALAEASERQFCMLWPDTLACGAPFHALFENDWDIRDVEARAVAGLPYISVWFDPLPDLLSSNLEDLVIGYPNWLISPDRYPAHNHLQARSLDFFNSLAPALVVQNQVNIFREQFFRDQMIGVHLRRGDFMRERPDTSGNIEPAVQVVDRFLDACPDAGILLCTDDGAAHLNGKRAPMMGVRQRFWERHGARMVQTAPGSLDRCKPDAIQAALVDLWLLRATQYFVGTATSSFSEMAVYGRQVPFVMTAASLPSFRRLEKLAHWSGIFKLVTKAGQHEFGRALPFPVLMNYYFQKPMRMAGRLLKRISPDIYHRLRRR